MGGRCTHGTCMQIFALVEEECRGGTIVRRSECAMTMDATVCAGGVRHSFRDACAVVIDLCTHLYGIVALKRIIC
jgi:hypothetical protein